MVDPDAVDRLENIELVIDGYAISVGPELVHNLEMFPVPYVKKNDAAKTEDDTETADVTVDGNSPVAGVAAEYTSVGELQAIVTIVSDAPVLDGAEEDFHYQRPRLAAEKALHRIVAHLRSVTWDVSVDTRLSGFRLVEYRDEYWNKVKVPEQWRARVSDLDSLPGKLAEDSWAEIARAVQAGDDVPLGRDWLLDSRAFFESRNYNMAVTAAAVACEIFTYDLIRRGMTANGRVSRTAANRFLERVSNRELLPIMLNFLEIGDAKLIEGVARVFQDRNDIIHGKRHHQVSVATAKATIHIAEALDSRVREQVEPSPKVSR